MLQQAGLTAAQIRRWAAAPSQFSIQAGIPYISIVAGMPALFVQDDWRIRPNLTFSLGLRYECAEH